MLDVQVRNIHMGAQPLARLVARPTPAAMRLVHARAAASILPRSSFQGRSSGFCHGCAALQMRAGFQTSAAATAKPEVDSAEGETHEYQAEVLTCPQHPHSMKWSTAQIMQLMMGQGAQCTALASEQKLMDRGAYLTFCGLMAGRERWRCAVMGSRMHCCREIEYQRYIPCHRARRRV